MKLSKFHQLRICVEVKNQLKEHTHHSFYVREDEDKNTKWIATKAGIPIFSYGREAGCIDIGEFITLTRDNIEMIEYRRIHADRHRRPNYGIKMYPKFEHINEKLISKTKQFEIENIPPSGPAKTVIGEIFRAIQYIQYRAGNDGDDWFDITRAPFMSGMYLMSKIDELNWSRHSYNEETGQHFFNFTDKFLKENSYDGKISNTIEHSLAEDADFIKYQLIDLLENGKIKDEPNDTDSRTFTKLQGNRY